MTYKSTMSALFLSMLLVLLSACGGESATESAAPAAAENEAPAAETAAAADAAADVAEAAFPTTALLDPNTASAEELTAVPGMSPAAAEAIVGARPFATPSEMDAAIGDTLDDASRQLVYAQVFVKVGLNSGAEDDYKLIPSTMSARKLAHEFEEYRPYESMEQFSREMSKYVSAEEVAYLERFVTLD